MLVLKSNSFQFQSFLLTKHLNVANSQRQGSRAAGDWEAHAQ